MKPVILIFARYYLPGYRAGGPIRSIESLVEMLGDDFEFRIIAQDRDLGDKHRYPNIKLDTWVRFGKGWVRHVSLRHFGLGAIVNIVRTTPHDLIYLNSFFDPRFTQLVLINRWFAKIDHRPIVLAPRGEFSKGALWIKRLKKYLYIFLTRVVNLYGGIVWQASSQFEANDIMRMYPVGKPGGLPGRVEITGNLVVAPDLVMCTTASCQNEARADRLAGVPVRVCFLSRISPMKNLDFALLVLELVRVPVRFTIYGPIEDQIYWTKCEVIISNLPSNIEVTYEGVVEHAEVVPTLAQHDLFFLPTRGENFGHVIHEALRAGLPLLISNKTPWRGLEQSGVGWDLPLEDIGAFANRIERIASWSTADFRKVRGCAHTLALHVGNDSTVIEANRNMFLDAINRRMPAKF